LQKEIEDGLVRLLVGALFPEGAPQSFAVLTTAPRQWVSLSSSNKIAIIDVGEITGPTVWVTEIDIRDRVLENIRAVGWPDNQVRIDHRSSSTVADLVVLDVDHKALAVVEVKRESARLKEGLDQACRYARSLGAKFGIVSDGRQFLFKDVDAEDVCGNDNFPKPQELQQDSLGVRIVETKSDDSGSTIVRPRTIHELTHHLEAFAATNLIIDHTFPWNDRESMIARQVRDFMGGVAHSFRHLDSITATLLVVAERKSTKRTVVLLPKGITFASQHSSLREFVASRLLLAGVLELPRGLFLPSTSISCVLVALGDFPISSGSKVAMAEIPSRGEILQIESQASFEDFKKGLRGEEMGLGVAFDADAIPSWSLSAVLSKLQEMLADAKRKRLQSLTKSTPLGDFCEIFRGFQHSREESKPEAGILVVRGRDLSSEALTKDELSWFKVDDHVGEKFKIVQGDVLLQRIGRNPRCAVVGSDLEGAIASDTLVVLRRTDSRANPALICQFLRSTMGQQLIQIGNRGRYAPSITISALWKKQWGQTSIN